jgi:hypothetical protein
MNKTNIMVEFSMIGEQFDSKVITQELLVEPTGYYSKGDKSKRNIERKETCWYLSTGYVETLFVSDVLKRIIEKLKDKIEKLNELKRKFDLIYKFFIVVNIEDKHTPAIYLDSEVIEFTNYIKAEFDFDIYIIS